MFARCLWQNEQKKCSQLYWKQKLENFYVEKIFLNWIQKLLKIPLHFDAKN